MSFLSSIIDFFSPLKSDYPQKQYKQSETESKEDVNFEQTPELKIEVETHYSEIPPLENDIKNQTQTEDGLYLHEYIMLKKNPFIDKVNNYFPKYWLYEWHVREPKNVVESLAERGFYAAADLTESFRFLTLTELKKIAKQFNLKISGRKAELIERIVSSVPEKQLTPFKTSSILVLSEKGKEAVSDDHFSSFLLLNQIELDEYAHKMDSENINVKKYKTFLWNAIYRKTFLESCSGSRYMYSDFDRNNIRAFKFLVAEGKADKALPFLCNSFWYNINFSGAVNDPWGLGEPYLTTFFVKDWIFRTRNLFEEQFMSAILGPCNPANFQTMKEAYKQNFNKVLSDSLNSITLPKEFISRSDAIDLINAAVDSDLERFKSIVRDISKKLINEAIRKNKQYKEQSVPDLLDDIFNKAKELKLIK